MLDSPGLCEVSKVVKYIYGWYGERGECLGAWEMAVTVAGE